MFFFGNPEDTALLYWERAQSLNGPAMPIGHFDELQPKQLRIAITYARMAFSLAEQEEQPREVLDILIDAYDQVFELLAATSEAFLDTIKRNQHRFLGGHSKENVRKYKRLAGLSES